MESLIHLIVDKNINAVDDDSIMRMFLFAIKQTSLSLEDLKTIEFEKFSDTLQQRCINHMIHENQPQDQLCVFLDKTRSVNYGNRSVCDTAKCEIESYKLQKDICICDTNLKVNPLLYYSSKGKLKLVQLLIEKYGADMEHPSYCDTTAIMFSAQKEHIETTKYLFDKGAKLSTSTHHIRRYASINLRELLMEWESAKINSQYSNIAKTLEQLKNEHEILEQKCDVILDIVRNI